MQITTKQTVERGTWRAEPFLPAATTWQVRELRGGVWRFRGNVRAVAGEAAIDAVSEWTLEAAVDAAISGWRGWEEEPDPRFHCACEQYEASRRSAKKAADLLRSAVREYEAGHFATAEQHADLAADIAEDDAFCTNAQRSAYDHARSMLGQLIEEALEAEEVTL